MRSAEVICMVSFGIYVAGFVLFIAGFAAPYWYEIEGVSRTGLWESCTTTGEENCDNIDLDDAPGWFKATVAMMIIALMFVVGAGLSAVWLPVTCGLQIFAGLFTIIGISIFGSEVNEMDDDSDVDYEFEWAFGLAAAAGGVFLFNGILIGVLSGYTGCSMERIFPCVACCYGFSSGGYGRDPYGYGYPRIDRRPTGGYGGYPMDRTQPSYFRKPGYAKPKMPVRDPYGPPSRGGYQTYPPPVPRYGGMGRLPRDDYGGYSMPY